VGGGRDEQAVRAAAQRAGAAVLMPGRFRKSARPYTLIGARAPRRRIGSPSW
jgi:hypothetical protein